MIRLWGWVVALLAAVFTLVPASADYTYDRPACAYAYAYDAPVQLSAPHVLAAAPRGSPAAPGAASCGGSVAVGGFGVAAETAGVDIAGARFAQNSFSESFSKGEGALFSGRTIDDVAGSLRSGAMSPKDVPIDVIVLDANSLILNTRSSQALIRAGIPRSSWNVIDRTGQAAYEARLSGQLSRNGLTSYGTDLP